MTNTLFTGLSHAYYYCEMSVPKLRWLLNSFLTWYELSLVYLTLLMVEEIQSHYFLIFMCYSYASSCYQMIINPNVILMYTPFLFYVNYHLSKWPSPYIIFNDVLKYNLWLFISLFFVLFLVQLTVNLSSFLMT